MTRVIGHLLDGCRLSTGFLWAAKRWLPAAVVHLRLPGEAAAPQEWVMGALVQAAAELHSLDALLLHHGGASTQVVSHWRTACADITKGLKYGSPMLTC